MMEVALQKQRVYLVEGALDRVRLGEDVHAVLVFFDHADDAAQVPFDAAEAGDHPLAGLRVLRRFEKRKRGPRHDCLPPPLREGIWSESSAGSDRGQGVRATTLRRPRADAGLRLAVLTGPRGRAAGVVTARGSGEDGAQLRGEVREVRIDWDESAVRAQIGGATKLRVAGTALLTAVEGLWSKGNLSLVEQIVFPDYHLFARRGRREVVLATGRHELKNRVLEVRRAFPDLRVQFSYPTDHGEEMAAAFEVSGTHRGKFFDVQPTARLLKHRALYRNRLKDGLVCESHIDLDLVVDDLRRT